LAAEADEVVALEVPRHLVAVGAWYDDFRQTTDDDVVRILDAAARRGAAPVGDPPSIAVDEEVQIAADGMQLEGHLTIPAGASGVVLFAHGSGSSRHSPRNRSVAAFLQQGGVGTLLFDLLEPDEATDRRKVFDIPLLATRLTQATEWVVSREDTAGLHIGYFGASTGAGAALWAAADPDARVDAIVSRGGRPDLAGARLAEVRAPTLLIVGSRDEIVLDLNREAARAMRCEHRVTVVPGASHLFEEPGTLAAAARLAREWFTERLANPMAFASTGSQPARGEAR
jgi:putative phosphoribosyl transferase